MERHGVRPKDHMKDNRSQLRAVQEKHRADREENERAGKECYKLSQFRDVSSRVYDEPVNSSLTGKHEGVYLQRNASERRREELAEESRQCRLQVEQKLEESRKYAQERQVEDRKASVPRADETARLAPRSGADFISKNKTEAKKMRPPAEHSDEGGMHEAYGRVPGYLQNRKAQWADAAEERRRNAPDPNCPPGMCLMPEDERIETLRTLNGSKSECMKQLERMPFVIETPSMKRKQEDLESKLREIDRAIEVFSKPKVYVAK
ncbi:Enkd1 [Symbiodinium microadriaticum]|nr:Enkd1 [Symbiodinium microadriaticum]